MSRRRTQPLRDAGRADRPHPRLVRLTLSGKRTAVTEKGVSRQQNHDEQYGEGEVNEDRKVIGQHQTSPRSDTHESPGRIRGDRAYPSVPRMMITNASGSVNGRRYHGAVCRFVTSTQPVGSAMTTEGRSSR